MVVTGCQENKAGSYVPTLAMVLLNAVMLKDCFGGQTSSSMLNKGRVT